MRSQNDEQDMARIHDAVQFLYQADATGESAYRDRLATQEARFPGEDDRRGRRAEATPRSTRCWKDLRSVQLEPARLRW